MIVEELVAVGVIVEELVAVGLIGVVAPGVGVGVSSFTAVGVTVPGRGTRVAETGVGAGLAMGVSSPTIGVWSIPDATSVGFGVTIITAVPGPGTRAVALVEVGDGSGCASAVDVGSLSPSPPPQPAATDSTNRCRSNRSPTLERARRNEGRVTPIIARELPE